MMLFKYRYKVGNMLVQAPFESEKLQSPTNQCVPSEKEQTVKENYYAQDFGKEPPSRAERKIKIISKTASQCSPERPKIFSPRDC